MANAKRYYIAYGSNLNTEQMKMCCPDAQLIGTSAIEGCELLFKGAGQALTSPLNRARTAAFPPQCGKSPQRMSAGLTAMRDLTFEQSCIIAGYGIVTALNFMSMGWTCRNNYTACYPSNTDVKDYFILVSRMFDWVGNTVIRTFWSKLDKPMTRRFADSILDTCNI